MPLGLDTETELISPGLQAPPLVCVSHFDGASAGVLTHLEAEGFVGDALAGEEALLGLNMAYDMAVLANEYPYLLGAVFAAYWAGRVRDVGLDQRLIDIANGEIKLFDKRKGSYSLAGLSARVLGEDLSKEDTPRLLYGRLRGQPIEAYSPAEIEYAEKDAIAPYRLYQAQLEVDRAWAAKWGTGLFTGAGVQARHAFCLHLATCWGVRSNGDRCRVLMDSLEREIDEARATLKEHGLVKPDGKRDIKAAQARMTQVMRARGLEPAMTKPSKTHPQGQVALDQEAVAVSGDDVLLAYTTAYSAHLLRKRIVDLARGAYVPLQAGYYILKDTGRTSCRKPSKPDPGRDPKAYGAQLQNMPQLEGSRESLEPRPGHIFIGADINAAEMHTLGQTLLETQGYSSLADLLNAGRDPHIYFGSKLKGMSYEDVAALEPKTLKNVRKLAKPGNFGIPGGMGAKSFVVYAGGKAYRVYLTLAEAEMHIKTFKTAYPEIVPYLKAIGRAVKSGPGTALFPWSQRWRGGMSYSAMANTYFQSRAADGALAAVDEVQRLAYSVPSSPLYGTRLWGFVHDELLAEVRVEQAREAALELGRVIGEEYNQFCPDVPTKAEPAIFWQWSKGVDPVWVGGNLVISDPENAPEWYGGACA